MLNPQLSTGTRRTAVRCFTKGSSPWKFAALLLVLAFSMPNMSVQAQELNKDLEMLKHSHRTLIARKSRKAPKNKDLQGRKAPAASYVTGYNSGTFTSILEGDNCFQITSISMSAVNASTQVGTFSNGSVAGLDIDEGIVLTTGSVAEAFTTNSSAGISNGTNDASAINDADLDGLSSTGLGTHDEAILEIEFDIPAGVNGFRIPFQFAGDEYPEYVCSIYNDVFAVFIDGPGLGGYQKISLVPGTSNPVSVNNLNGGSCGAYGSGEPSDLTQGALFIDNNDGSAGGPIYSEFDGFTVALYAEQGGLASGTYQLKLAIGDLGDSGWDSGVFFGAMEATSGGQALDCSCIANPLADPNGDCDNDGTLNGNEVDAAAALNPCDPDPLAIGTGDCDSDGTLNQDETDATAALDPCDPDPLGLNVGDCDNDGTLNQDETDATAALDPCDPDPLAIGSGDCDGDNIANQDDDCPLVPGVAPHGCPDNDLDGYPDAVDLDDDNDGILDIDEMQCSTSQDISQLTFSGTAVASSTSNSITNANSGWKSSYSNEQFELPIHLEFTITSTSGYGMIGLIPIAASHTANTWNDGGYKWYFANARMYGKFPNAWTPSGVVIATNDLFEIDISVSGYVTCSRNGSIVRQFAGTNSDYHLAVTSYRTRTYANMVLTAPNVGGPCSTQDTDLDNIPDHFDTDADGDGCFDAIEGAASFLIGNVDPGGMLLGAVDGNGVPISAGSSGQGIGVSQDAAQLGADCSVLANSDTQDVVKNNVTLCDVLANDAFSANIADMTITILSGPSQGGLATIDESGANAVISYTPANEYLGPDTVVYQISTPSGATAFDTLFLNIYSPLPIDLISFDAYPDQDNNMVNLVWLTATEINNELFIVLRSNDTETWNEVAEVEGMGHSNQTVEYRETDRHPLNGINYYKLRQIDYDGSSTDSEIKVVQFDMKMQLVLYPNPASGKFTIVDSNLDLDPHTVSDDIKLYDTTGRPVSINLSASQGMIHVVLPSNMSAGHYLLVVKDEPHIMQLH